jgi:PrcB C-terminal
MLDIRTSIVVALLSLTINGASAAGCSTMEQSAQNNRPTKNRNATPTRSPVERGNVKSELRILSQGGQSSVFESFVAVARDAETYGELRRLDNRLPELSADSFNHAAVVAAFLGERRTGGFGVEVTRAADGAVRISESSPGEGMMSTQVLTTPYTIVSVPIENERPLRLELDQTWQLSMRPYRVTAGEFTMTGGIAGRSENSRLEGGFKLMRQANLATIILDVKSAGGTKARELKEATTGIIRGNGEVGFARFNAGSLVEPPANLLTAKGQFTNNEGDLVLSLESLPSNVADGFQGRGRLTAKATGPPPPKRALNSQEVM